MDLEAGNASQEGWRVQEDVSPLTMSLRTAGSSNNQTPSQDTARSLPIDVEGTSPPRYPSIRCA